MYNTRNRFLFILVITILVGLLNLISVCASTLPQEIVIADENFEGTVDMTKWSIAAGARTTFDTYTVVPEPGDEGNKVIKLTYRGDKFVSSGSTSFLYDFADVPNSGKLFISYKVKLIDPSNIITNNYPNLFMLSASSGGAVTSTATAIYNNNASSGASAGAASGAKLDGTASGSLNIGAGFGGAWSNISCVVDFSTKEVKYYREGLPILPSQLYLVGASSFDRGVRLKFYLRETSAWDGTKSDANLYVDNIVIKRIPQLLVENGTNDNNVDPEQALEMDFSTPITSQSLATAIKIKENENVIENAISIATSTDGKKAFITPAGYLKYGKSYKIEIANTLLDIYGQTLASPYIFDFTTKYAKGINILGTLNVSPQDTSGNPTVLANAIKLTAKVTVNNPTTEISNAWILVGLYGDNNVFLGMKSEVIAGIPSNGNSGEQEFIFNNLPTGTKSVKAFIWDNMNDITVAHSPIEYK